MGFLAEAIWVLGIIWVFVLTKGLFSGEPKRTSLIYLASLMVLFVGGATQQYIKYQENIFALDAVESERDRYPIDESMRSRLDPENEDHRDFVLARASDVFRYTGALENRLRENGEWVKYCPSEESIKEREEFLAIKRDLRSNLNDIRRAMGQSVLGLLMAMAIGLIYGRYEYRRIGRE